MTLQSFHLDDSPILPPMDDDVPTPMDDDENFLDAIDIDIDEDPLMDAKLAAKQAKAAAKQAEYAKQANQQNEINQDILDDLPGSYLSEEEELQQEDDYNAMMARKAARKARMAARKAREAFEELPSSDVENEAEEAEIAAKTAELDAEEAEFLKNNPHFLEEEEGYFSKAKKGLSGINSYLYNKSIGKLTAGQARVLWLSKQKEIPMKVRLALLTAKSDVFFRGGKVPLFKNGKPVIKHGKVLQGGRLPMLRKSGSKI